MTDKEIIQALRCCEKEVCADGGLCPLFSDADCIVHLGKAAIDLIERLTAENAKAEAERDALQEKQRWIPVTERMPNTIPCNAGTEYSEAVIVWTTGNKAMIAVWDGIDFICPTDFWEAWGEEITHWMPLPEAPEEVLPKNMADEIALKLMRLADLEAICSFARLRELAEADKDGRVLILPCAPDAIYWEKVGGILAQSRFEGLHVYEDGTIKYAGYGMEICAEDIGKTVFLSREEAEKALQEMEGKKDGNETSM